MSAIFPARRRFLAGNLVFIAFLVALALFSVYQSRLHYRQLNQLALENLSLVLANNLGAMIEKTDVSLRTIALEIGHQLDREGAMDPAAVRQILAEQRSLQPDLHALRIAGPDGIIRYSSGTAPPAGASVADRDYFQRLRDDPRDGLTVGAPYLSRMGTYRIVPIARRLDGPDGSFAGVVYAAITIDHFKDLLSSLDPGPNGSVALLTEDRRLIARVPSPKDGQALEKTVLRQPSREQLRAAPRYGTFAATSPFDGISRNCVYRRVSDLPLYVVMGHARRDTLAVWWREDAIVLTVVAAFGLLSLWLLRSAQRAAGLGQFRTLVEQAPMAIAMLDREMRYVAASARWMEIYGSHVDRLIGRDHYEVHPGLPTSWKEVHRAALSGIPQRNQEAFWPGADGSRHWSSWAVHPWRDGRGRIGGIIIVAEDITERKLAEEEIQRMNAMLERQVEKRTSELAQSNDALLHSNMELQHFAHATAHDLQTPLRSIASFTQLLQHAMEERGDEQVREWSSLVVDNTRRLQDLIQNLLAYTRVDAQGLPFETVDLGAVLDEVLASLAVLIQETGAEVRHGHIPTLPVDRFQIAQVFQNLIENGIKYNHSKPPRVSITADLQQDEWVFSVADNGIGIDPKHHERIFEMFRRLHTYSQVAGSGIGLALCRRIVERHGGHIWVESRLGEGSTFYFTLPVRTAAPAG
ncbi:MAG TPA: ATP-binding protein [Rhodocyclaceae bacterium]|nr:ATP-binding protein [Rhodocyclaceae bacterium]